MGCNCCYQLVYSLGFRDLLQGLPFTIRHNRELWWDYYLGASYFKLGTSLYFRIQLQISPSDLTRLDSAQRSGSVQQNVVRRPLSSGISASKVSCPGFGREIKHQGAVAFQHRWRLLCGDDPVTFLDVAALQEYSKCTTFSSCTFHCLVCWSNHDIVSLILPHFSLTQ